MKYIRQIYGSKCVTGFMLKAHTPEPTPPSPLPLTSVLRASCSERTEVAVGLGLGLLYVGLNTKAVYGLRRYTDTAFICWAVQVNKSSHATVTMPV